MSNSIKLSTTKVDQTLTVKVGFISINLQLDELRSNVESAIVLMEKFGVIDSDKIGLIEEDELVNKVFSIAEAVLKCEHFVCVMDFNVNTGEILLEKSEMRGASFNVFKYIELFEFLKNGPSKSKDVEKEEPVQEESVEDDSEKRTDYEEFRDGVEKELAERRRLRNENPEITDEELVRKINDL